MRDFESKMSNGGSWQFICRACRSIQIMRRNELVCSRDQLCKVLDIRTSAIDKVMPEHPRPRSFGDAGKISVDDLRPIMDR